jgi:hypothetical protein
MSDGNDTAGERSSTVDSTANRTVLHLDSGRRELAHRTADGVDVTLHWTPRMNTLYVAVHDRRTDDAFELVLAPGDNPLHVFHHPYAYAAWRGIDFRVPESMAA